MHKFSNFLNKISTPIDYSKSKTVSFSSSSGKTKYEYTYLEPKDVPMEIRKKLDKNPKKNPFDYSGFLTKIPINRKGDYVDGYLVKDVKEFESNLSKSSDKQRLKEIKQKYNSQINSIHKNKFLKFKLLPLSEYKSMSKILIYKSPVYRGSQSSEYHIGMYKGKPVYVRKSNHWGDFSVNITDVDEATNELKITKERAKDLQMEDIFGRIGWKSMKWDLIGGKKNGKEYSKISQVGFVPLEKFNIV